MNFWNPTPIPPMVLIGEFAAAGVMEVRQLIAMLANGDPPLEGDLRALEARFLGIATETARIARERA